VNLLERIRGFWKPRPAGDHPLTERERDEDRPRTAYDERARTAEEFIGDDAARVARTHGGEPALEVV
jgi:hypothetical protein